MDKHLSLLIFIAAVAVSGQYLLRLGLRDLALSVTSLPEFARQLFSIMTRPLVLVALALYAVGMVLYMFLVSQLELSKLYPASMGLNFVLVTLAAWFLLGESVTITRMVGIAIILLGIFLVVRS